MIVVSVILGSSSQLSPQSSKNLQMTPVQKLLNNVVPMPIASIIKLPNITFCATLVKQRYWLRLPSVGIIVHAMLAHALHAVTNHHLSVRPIILLRYKIEIEVCHGGKACNFVFWNRECKFLLGLTASQLRHTMAEITDPLEFALALDYVLNLEMAFKDVAPVPSIISDLLQIKECIDEAKTYVLEENDLVAVTFISLTELEITSKHNPYPTTPAGKR
ncbi:hypothetical protein RYX36_010060 [Vicia faba]